MSDKNKDIENEARKDSDDAGEPTSRRDFLRSLGKWSGVLIGAVTAANLLDPPSAAGWVNGGGGRSWVNARGGGGGGWVNRNGGGGGSWINRSGGGGWVNRSGGGGSWINNRGGWINRY